MKSSWKFFLFVLLSTQCLVAVRSFDYDDDDENDYDYEKKSPSVSNPLDACPRIQKGGVEWLLSVWNAEKGWGDQTPRALIVLAMAGFPGVSSEQIRQMELQLDVEVTTILLRNHATPIHSTDLVLFVQALLAMGRNPRDFYGRDLIALLLQAPANHPALILGLCDARAAAQTHVQAAQNLLQGYLRTKDIDYLALALKAYTCLKSLELYVHDNLIADAQKYLISLQLPDGSFGNLYTTSLVVQALATTKLKWDLKAALKFLDAHSTLNPNMVSTYLILMAEHCGKFNFVKDIHPDLKIEPVVPKRDDGIFVQYSVKTSPIADYYFTISIKMPKDATFFDVMEASQMHDSKFKFESYEDQNRNRSVYSISGVPNDAESNQFWHLCLQRDVNHVLHTYTIKTLTETPVHVKLQENDHFIYWFRETKCEESSQLSSLY